jgi:uncharacterized protein DUF1835
MAIKKIKTLHIVDGESTGGSLRQAGLGRKGDILRWRDALSTGPVPRGLTLRRLSRLRSRFWTGKSATEFDKRDATLTHHAEYDEVVLWFGATSICQLSLVQLLAWFDEHSRGNTRLRLVFAYGGWLRPATSSGLQRPPADYSSSEAPRPTGLVCVLLAIPESALPFVNH